jgi:hypothetical protein
MRYNFELLNNYCNENNIILKKDYSKEKINRDTIIEAKCLKCDDICSKGFREFMKIGCFCKKHTEENRKEKIKATNLERRECEYPTQNKEVREKCKETCLKNWGVEYSMQNKEVREKCKETCLKNWGVEYSMQNKEVLDKAKATNLERYGFENPLQNKEIKEKIKETNLERYGFENPFQNEEIKEKIKETNLERYGFENPFQNEEIKEKIKETNLERYGFEHPCQNAEVSEKASKNAYKSYDYIFPSGRVEKIQGYEKYMLNDLLQKEGIQEDDIILKRSEVPAVWYEDIDGIQRRYFVDCFIKSQNRCIEAKSTWTAEKKKDCIYLKQKALKDAGYLCEIWIYDGNGEIVDKI